MFYFYLFIGLHVMHLTFRVALDDGQTPTRFVAVSPTLSHFCWPVCASLSKFYDNAQIDTPFHAEAAAGNVAACVGYLEHGQSPVDRDAVRVKFLARQPVGNVPSLH